MFLQARRPSLHETNTDGHKLTTSDSVAPTSNNFQLLFNWLIQPIFMQSFHIRTGREM